MKRTSLTTAILLFLASPASVLAEEQVISAETQAVSAEVQAISAEVEAVVADEPAVPDKPPVTVVSAAETSTLENAAASHQMHDMRMMHKGKGRHGRGQGGMKHGGGKHGRGMHQKHEQVVQRLDMIEARMAKIEAMLEILIRR